MKNEENHTQIIQLHRAILHELGYEINQKSTILDFGCGAGEMVDQYRNAGFNAFGADIELERENEFLRLIRNDKNGYHIPFGDKTFDFIFSDQVFEHVQNYSQALSEIWRILKPNGCSLHCFPSKYKPIEPHIFVPFAGMFQGYPWLLFWAFLGIRNSYQKQLKFQDVAYSNFNYLRDKTHYLSKKDIQKYIADYSDSMVFAEKYFIKHSSGNSRYIYPLVKGFPFISSLYSSFHCRVVFFRKNSPRTS
jgi:SAM-dependent methyltransferase